MIPREIRPRLNAVFQSVFDDSSIEIEDATTASDIAQWDSLTHINLILAIERSFAVRFTTREVRALKTVGDLIVLIQHKTP
ncbi:MAG: acyl carrier protein [Bradyrhizobium sp.]|uniref:acyl carrier protein n=1 Tax=Bradyrhizobium sp. TaxID=376 RepID=UPI001C28534B|nr:acyl carrier protein [Bradyrhizobium sp.]MBU6461260.1 acyl carrier protein [Pseudomonadota bacterium]MDE2065742.1 acyl carrier protein [Bradyrhizobium sp.]MDE2241820.1 acyl carrier protein [Bradyrhizobium sp.]MDE2470502.1 acyl carrier protein [Bradyrhizobium sp.]